MISALAQYGFSKFLVIDPDQKKAKEFVNRLSKLFFEQDTQSDSVDAIIAKAAESSVIVNCVPSGQSDEFVKDFCYFNYLTSKGLVIETNLYPVDSLLLSEARKVGIRSIPGYLIRGRADSLWVQQVTNASLRVEEYQMGLHLSCSRSTSA
jgi:shikimate dehydrogenase